MRDFIWCRQEIAEGCSAPGGRYVLEEHVHICITTPGYRRITPACGQKTLNLFFHDLDPEAIRRTVKFGEDPVLGQQLIDGCLSDGQAREIVAFVKATGESKVVVNCEAGISRSPGVVLALRRFYGGNTEEPFKLAHPNIHVTTTLYKVLHESRS